jgi:hypothetical protein
VEGQTFAAEVTQTVRDESDATVIPRRANAQIIITSASKGGRFTKASDLSDQGRIENINRESRPRDWDG